MLLAIDIGNSSIKFGVYDRENLTTKFSIPTNRKYSSTEIKLAVGNKLKETVTHAVASSVVPEVETTLAEFCNEQLGIEIVFVNNSFDFGLKINYKPILSVGTDRLIAAFAASEKHGKPCIVCDFGTATTIDAVSSNSEYLGGIIAPGMGTMAEVLHLKTSKLPHVAIEKPANVIGNSTVKSIQSGIFYGYIGLVEGIISRMQKELLLPLMITAGGSNMRIKVVATGGFASLISENCKVIDIVEDNLILNGLQLTYERRLVQQDLEDQSVLDE